MYFSTLKRMNQRGLLNSVFLIKCADSNNLYASFMLIWYLRCVDSFLGGVWLSLFFWVGFDCCC